MADTGDLKSPVRIERTGSSPVGGTENKSLFFGDKK
jgi:hypothetical protein